MKKAGRLFLVGILIFSAPFAAAAEIYKWVDKDGKVHFSDSPPAGGDAEVKKMKEEPPGNPRAGEAPKQKGQEPSGQKLARQVQVIMYMTSWCTYCNQARSYLNSLGVHLTEFNIEKDPSSRKEMLAKSGGLSGVPLIDVEGIIIRGFNREAIRTAVEKKKN